MSKKKRVKKIITLIAAAALLAVTVIPAASFADSADNEGYVYKYIGTDNNNKGESISYYDTTSRRNSGGSTVMFKLKKDSDSKIDLAYCCDLDTYTVNNTYYKRTNLENAGYFKADVARKIRNVVVHGYDPANAESINKLRAAVNEWAEKNNKQERVDTLSKANAITATQLAIWSLSNPEMKPSSSSSTVTLVKEYLVSLPEYTAAPDEIVAESIGITVDPDTDSENNTTAVSGTFNFYSEPDNGITKVTPKGEDIVLSISAGSTTILSGNLQEMIEEGEVELDADTLDYRFEIALEDIGALTGDVDISIAVSGIQDLPRGAYFYKTPDRSDSQNFVGIAAWDKSIALSSLTTVTIPEPKTPTEPETPAEPEQPDTLTEPDTPGEPEYPQTPKTGDETNMLLWAMMAVTSLAIIGVTMVIKRKEA